MIRTTVLPLCLATAALLGGCAAPNAERPAPRETAQLPAQWSQPTPPGAAPAELRGWWKAFGDATLDGLVQEALAHNLDVAQALSRVREARLQSGRADVQFRPSLTASARTLQDIAAEDTYFHASIDTVWELGLFGAAESTRQVGASDAAAAQAEAQGVRVLVVADVVRHYLDLRAAQRQLQGLARLAEVDERSAALAEVRVRTQLGPADEVAQARLRAAQVRAAQALPREVAARAAQSLALLLGRAAPDPAWSAAGAAPALAPFALAELPADLLRTRPDIQTAEAGVYKAAAVLGLSRSELYPRVVLMGSLLYSYNITRNLRTRVSSSPLLGPVIDIPLFDWGRRQMQVQASQEALNAALLGYRRAVLQAVAEAEGALAAMAAQQTRADALGQALAIARERVGTTQTQARLGLASEYQGLAQRRQQLESESELALAQDARALAFVALYKALGGAPLPAPDTTAEAEAQAGKAP